MVFQTRSFIENRRGNYCRSRRIRTRPVTLLPCDNIQSMEKDYKVVRGVENGGKTDSFDIQSILTRNTGIYRTVFLELPHQNRPRILNYFFS